MENAPFFEDLAQGPAGGVAHWVTTSDGLNIRVAHWTGADVKGTILLFPGRTEYIEKYGPAAAEFLARGYATVAIDWRGQGMSARTNAIRTIGDVADFKDYQKDVAAMLAHVRMLGLPEPYYLLAHSMGGCIGLRALLDGLPVKAAAFSAPMWGIAMSPVMRPLAWTMSWAAGILGFAHLMAPGQNNGAYVLSTAFADNALTTDPDTFKVMQHHVTAQPDFILGGPSLRWLNESLREMRELARAPSPNLPCVTFLGSDESIVVADAIRTRMAKWPNGTLQMINGARHEVILEKPPIRTQVFDQITGLFDKHR
ncbi:alpha/beta hydrolase [Yoonia sp. MH D7]